MEFRGILKGVVATRSGKSANGKWERRVYLVEEVASFPKKMVFEIADGEMGRYAKWDALVGKSVVVRFGIDASEYNGRYFNNISAWDIWEPKSEPSQPSGNAAGTVAEAQKGGSFDELMKHDAVAAQAMALNEMKEHGTGGDGLPF